MAESGPTQPRQIDGVEYDVEHLSVAVDGSRIWRGDVTYVPDEVFVVAHAEDLIGIASSEAVAQKMAQTHTRRYGSNYGAVRVFGAKIDCD